MSQHSIMAPSSSSIASFSCLARIHALPSSANSLSTLSLVHRVLSSSACRRASARMPCSPGEANRRRQADTSQVAPNTLRQRDGLLSNDRQLKVECVRSSGSKDEGGPG